MNIKKTIQILLIFTTLIRVCYANPLIIKDPLIVETGDTPLQVTVTNIHEQGNVNPIKIPFTSGFTCNTRNEEKFCKRIGAVRENNFPEGTNMAVIEQISYEINSSPEQSQQTFDLTFYTWLDDRQHWTYLPSFTVKRSEGGGSRLHAQSTHAVTLYHNGICEFSDDIGCPLSFRFEMDFIHKADTTIGHIYISGYYTNN